MIGESAHFVLPLEIKAGNKSQRDHGALPTEPALVAGFSLSGLYCSLRAACVRLSVIVKSCRLFSTFCFTIVLPVVLPSLYQHANQTILPMWTIKPVLWAHKPNPPIMIRVIIERKPVYIKTPYRIKVNEWNDKPDDNRYVIKNANARQINHGLSVRVAEYHQKLSAADSARQEVNAKTVKHILTGKVIGRKVEGYVRSLMTDKNRAIYNKELNRLLAFAPNCHLGDITPEWLRKYEAHERKRGMKQNTLNTTFKWLRRVLNIATEDGLILANPIRKVPRYEQSERIFLIKAERDALVKCWSDHKVDGSLYISLTYFLLGVFSGLRHSDWAGVMARVEGNILRLRAQKNKEWVVLPIGPTLASVLKEIKRLPPPFSGDKTRVHLKIISGQLGMSKKITTHTARHSFGAMCAEIGLSKSTTAGLMGISERTAEVYFHLTGTNIMLQAAALKAM